MQGRQLAELSIGSLFSGIGGLELGLEWAGLGPVMWQVEINEHCRQVLQKHWPEARRYTNVREVGIHNLERVQLICGGFPCQDVSGAGSRAGLAGARSGLWYEFRRIVSELRPAWVVVENVASGARRWVDPVCRSLGELGYDTLPIPIAAFEVGAPHLRRRIFLVAYADSEPIRYQRQRQSGGPPNRVRSPRDTQPANHGSPRSAPNTDEHRAQSRGSVGSNLEDLERGPTVNNNHAQPPADSKRRTPWTLGPPVRGVANGPTTRLDKARLKMLGNAVVPQCAQVVGEVIQMLRDPPSLTKKL